MQTFGTETKIKNIIFDIGNVISKFDWEGTYRDRGYRGETLERLGKATALSDDWKEFDRGFLTAGEVIDRFVENDPGIETEIRDALSDFAPIVKKVEYAIPWITALKEAGYRCYFLSNFSKIAEESCTEALSFMYLMDGGILSWKEKVIKPDPAIYKLLLGRYDLKPEECVFLDDTAENLPPANALGIRTIRFVSKDQAVEDLRLLGVETKKF
jgi:putative hydrolase of the HAD superfamily